MSDYFLAVDGGSQSTKVSVIDEVGVVHATAQVALKPYELGPHGRAVHPGDDLWDTLVLAARRAVADFAGNVDDIVAVGLCGIRFCRALMDADGRLTEPVLSWMDARVSQPLRAIAPEVALVASAGGHLSVRLTGERRDSAASYQGMWPIDPVTRAWSTDPAQTDRTGMPVDLLPELVDPGGLLGRVTPEASQQTGIPCGLPVYATANDKAVEALGSGLLASGSVLLSLGTYIASMTVGESLAADDDRYWVNAAAVPGRYLYESGGIRRGMWTVSWLRQLVSAAVPDLVDPQAVQRWLEEAARDVPPGCGGLLTVPDWLAPGHAPHRRGAILGLDGSHGAPHLYRSILEGIVITMRGHTEAMETALGLPAQGLVVSGGGARSDLLTQIAADVYDRPVERAAVADAAGLGAAVCAAVGHGTYPDFETAVRAMTRPGQVFEPDGASRRRYDEVVAVYQDLTEFTDPLFHRMAPLSS
ncbi:kinase [Nocardioides szechwanensis]|uniref:Sugar (Pentulose or hexulose) kinase n=1 Tax=Nocardioides szechwanensis TaxID=1005944 RepID=A0A1H0GZB5_9ACTN|nr:FGGY-family carbohydrate kinase [Nocardioides szechwanensis]GEP34120.1 kinase [Nocardioides szechwanensis]SDO12218.1 Sugar (pentulose or hexulose) kinase [Nocardioides szechwanensis]